VTTTTESHRHYRAPNVAPSDSASRCVA